MYNDILHVIAGALLCYLFIPKAELWVLIFFTTGLAGLREHIQGLRNHKQLFFSRFTDTLGWTVVSIIYYILREYYGLDADNASYYNKSLILM